MTPDNDNIEWMKALIYASFAALGGTLGYVMRSLDSGAKLLWWRALFEGVSAAFVGLLAMWLCQSAGLSQQWTAVTVGICGWLGATASIQVLQRLVWDRLGLNKIKDDDYV